MCFGVSLVLQSLYANTPKVGQKWRKESKKRQTLFWPMAKQGKDRKKPKPINLN
jgi:hypothetical protein